MKPVQFIQSIRCEIENAASGSSSWCAHGQVRFETLKLLECLNCFARAQFEKLAIGNARKWHWSCFCSNERVARLSFSFRCFWSAEIWDLRMINDELKCFRMSSPCIEAKHRNVDELERANDWLSVRTNDWLRTAKVKERELEIWESNWIDHKVSRWSVCSKLCIISIRDKRFNCRLHCDVHRGLIWHHIAMKSSNSNELSN